jgi:hypothetical protein
MSRIFAARDSGGSFTLPPGGTGPIIDMCVLPDRVELYTVDATFMAQPPEVIDPNRTNPNAQWVIAKTDDIGSGSPAVARSFLTASRVLKQATFPPPIDRDAILLQMHVIKGLLVTCAKTAAKFAGAVQTEMDATERERNSRAQGGGRALAHFPMVNDLDQLATTCLINAKRAIREICLLVDLFFKLDRSHSRLDHLVSALATKLGADSTLVQYLNEFTKFATRVVKLRDGQEHSVSTTARLYVENFRMMPTNQIKAPVWYLEGETPRDIQADMSFIENSLIDLAEGAFIGCVANCLNGAFPMCFQFNENPKPEAPVRYELVVDVSQLRGVFPDSPASTS